MQAGQEHVDELDADEGRDDPADPVDEDVVAQQTAHAIMQQHQQAAPPSGRPVTVAEVRRRNAWDHWMLTHAAPSEAEEEDDRSGARRVRRR